jgi:ABC-type multidrug transport system permease subunit
VNLPAIRAIYRFEMARTFRTWMQSILSPVLSTSLYFVVFGSAIGSRMGTVNGVDYGSFIVPGLVMLSLLGESISNASFGIFLPKFSGTIYELLSSPIDFVEVMIGYVGRGLEVAAARRADPRHRAGVRAVSHPPSGLDGRVPRADRGHVLHVRLHHRPVGR